MALVEAGHWVILNMADGKQHLVQALGGKTQRLGKHWFKLDRLIGAAYGSIFEVKGRDLVAIQSNELFEDIAIPDFEGAADAYEPGETDNRDFSDTNTAQRLTAQDVRGLKEGGASGQELLQALVQGSDTWDKKTSFAKQKWATKKLAKHVVRFRVVRCDTRTLAECTFLKNSIRGSPTIGLDSLAQMLTLSNLHAGARVLVCETMGGIVVASVLERLGGHGRLLHFYGTQQPSCEAVRYLNLPSSHTSIITPIPSCQLALLEADEEPVEPTLESIIIDPQPRDGGPPLDEAGVEVIRQKRLARLRSKYEEKKAVRDQLRQGVDSIILASKFDPTKLLPRLLRFLNPSCPFVIFSEYLEPLVQCFSYLQDHQEEAGVATTKLQMSCTWMRDYQIKPGRSHPNMSMTTDGAYLLTGIKLLTPLSPPPPATTTAPAPSSSITAVEEEEKGAGENAAKRQKTGDEA